MVRLLPLLLALSVLPARLIDKRAYDSALDALDDEDGDGLDAAGGDCDDNDPDRYPGATEIWYDGIDQDCAGGDAYDADLDGQQSADYGGDDCDNADPTVYDGAEETGANGATDNDCDGVIETITLEYGASAWEGESAGGQAGRRLAAVGDVDGDGLDEALVAATNESSDFENGGAVYLVSGAPGPGLGTFPAIRAEADSWFLGGALDGGVDFDGDGVLDLLVGATGADESAGITWLLSGAAVLDGADTPSGAAFAEILGDDPETYSGTDARIVGDLDGDGQLDLAISAPYTDTSEATDLGLIGVVTQTPNGDLSLSDADIQVYGEFTGAALGNQVAPAGDIDGDGYDDLFASEEPGVLGVIIPGGQSSVTLPDDAIFRLAGTSDTETAEVRMIGDVDGDGAQDLACIEDDVSIFRALAGTPTRVSTDPTAVIRLGDGNQAFDIASLGDLDGSGGADILVPVLYHAERATSVAAIHFGESLTLGADIDLLDAALTAESVRPVSTTATAPWSPGTWMEMDWERSCLAGTRTTRAAWTQERS